MTREPRAQQATAPTDMNKLLEGGFAAIDRKDIIAAERLFNTAAKLDPKNPWPLLGAALLQMEMRDMDAALDMAAKARKLNCPPDVLCKLGIFYKEAGAPETAVDCLRGALAKDPGSIAAWYNLRDLKKFTADDADVVKLEALSARSAGLPVPKQAQLHFVLGKVYLDLGDADKAFGHFDKGNALKRAGQTYNIAAFEQYIAEIIRCFDPRAVERLRGKVTVRTDRPVFIVGMPRSGSTLVDQIIASHPDAASIGESRLLQDAIPVVTGARAPVISDSFMAQLTPDTLDSIVQRYLASTEPFAKNAARVADKMLFNFIWVGIMRLAFPAARVIHCTRGAADMGLSIWRTHFAGNVPWAFDQREIARYILACERLVAHWHRLFPGEILDISYEAMVADQAGQTRRLLDFCGLPWDDRCLDFHKTRRRVSTASDMQVRKPIYNGSIGGGKTYARYLKPLLETLEAKR